MRQYAIAGKIAVLWVFIAAQSLYSETSASDLNVQVIRSQKQLTLYEQISSTDWQPSEKLTFGLTGDVVHLKISYKRKPGEDLLVFEHPLIDTIRVVFTDEESNSASEYKTGRLVSHSRRQFHTRRFAVAIPDSYQSGSVYISAASRNSLDLRMEFMAHNQFFAEEIPTQLSLGLFYGGLIVIAIYNIAIFLSLRDRVYLIYGFYLLAFTFFLSSMTGILNQYILSAVPLLASSSVNLGIGLTILFVVPFSLDFISLKKNSKFLYRTYLVFWFIGLIYSVLAVLIDRPFIAMAGVTLGFIFTALLIAGGYIALRKGQREAKVFLVSWVILLATIVIAGIALFTAYQDYWFVRLFFPVGAIFQVILLSLGLADRINILNRSLDREQERLQEKEKSLSHVVENAAAIARGLKILAGRQKDAVAQLVKLAEEESSMSEEMSAALQELTESNSNIAASMETMSSEGRKTSGFVNMLKQAHDKIMQYSEKSSSAIDRMKMSMQETGHKMDSLAHSMSEIKAGGKSVSNLVKMIQEITEKINMLSLNASIEAARAGEQGRGFAVVADEVGKLAEETGGNSKNINNQVDVIQKSIEKGSVFVDEGTDALVSLMKELGEVQSEVNSTRTLLEQQNASVDQLLNQAQLVDSHSTEVAASAEEQLASMQESLTSVQRLSDMAGALQSVCDELTEMADEIRNRSVDLESSLKSASQDSIALADSPHG